MSAEDEVNSEYKEKTEDDWKDEWGHSPPLPIGL